jgi:glutamate synthase domain-containing protein 3
LVTLDCEGKSTREINLFLRNQSERGEQVKVLNSRARHNLAVCILHPADITFEDSVGYYCGSMGEGIKIRVHGNAGWAVGENLMAGSIEVDGNAGACAGATIRGGSIYVHGDGGPRCGISQKGGTLIIGGAVGYMSGFMMQKGTMVICGDADEGLGDSLYEGRIFLAGKCPSYGADAVEEEVTDEDVRWLDEAFGEFGVENVGKFRKIVAGKKLWNFSHEQVELWKVAL